MFSKLFSTFLSILLMLQTLVPTFVGAKKDLPADSAEYAARENVRTLSEYVDYIHEYGAPSMATDTFFSALKPVKFLRTLFSGSLFADEQDKYLSVSMSEDLATMCDAILAESGFSMLGSLQHLPRTLGGLTALKRSLRPDLGNFRHAAIDLSAKLRGDGHTAAATLLYLFGVFFSVVDDLTIYTVPGEAEGELTVLMDVTYADGTKETVDPDIVIDTVRQVAYARQGYGVAGSGFEVDLEDMLLYTVVRSWQSKFGFCLGYDVHAATDPVFNYLTRRFAFSYGGKAWRVQVWKGNYALVTNGGELGLYTRSPYRIGSYYDAASEEDSLVMSMDVLHGDETLVSRAPERHWWVTGFKLSDTLYTPDSLTVKFTVELKDEAMLKAFTAAIDRELHRDVSYTVDGLTVSAVW